MTVANCLRIALRYTFARGDSQLSSFMSGVAITGLVLAVGLLLTVLSIMNGFDREMRERILAFVPHVTLHAVGEQATPALRRELARHPDVVSVEPFVPFQGLVVRNAAVEAVAGLGVSGPFAGQLRAFLVEPVSGGRGWEDHQALWLGQPLAERLGLAPGDRVSLIVPSTRNGSALSAAQTRAFTLQGLLRTGTELDESLAVVPLAVGSEMAGLDGMPGGFRLQVTDVFAASAVRRDLSLHIPPGTYLTDWTMTHGNLYAAIQLSRQLITLLLLSVIGVAAFNVVSSLVLVVIDKRGDIAILRTLGATPAAIATVFIGQGAMIGAIGALLGSSVGAALSVAVPALVRRVESLLNTTLLATDVYPVSFIPSDLRLTDVALVAGASLCMCLLASLYPAVRGARLPPAEVLQREI